MKKFAKLSVLVAMAIILSFASLGCVFLSPKQESEIPEIIAQAHNVVINSGVSERQKMDRVDAIEKVSRSVVAITMEDGSGSGVIVNVQRTDENGQNIDDDTVFYILTCFHVVQGKGDINVYLPDTEGDNWGESDYNENYCFTGKIGGSFTDPVTLIGGDQTSDIAVLRLNVAGSAVSKDNIVKANLAPSTGYTMKVGEDVFAIGNPSGILPGSVTVGTIGYINREVVISGIGDMTLIQLNTDIYHGSSGGALFNLYGEVIGITNSGSDSYIGIGYAIPFAVNSAEDLKDSGFINITKQLLGSYTGTNYGYVSGRMEKFGFTCQAIDEADGGGVKVAYLTEGSQASKSSMAVGDIVKQVRILRYKGMSGGSKTYETGQLIDIDSLSKLSQAIQTLEINDVLEVNLIRISGKSQTSLLVRFTAKQFYFCDTGVYPNS